MSNSNLLRPIVVPPQTIEEITRQLAEATAKIMGTYGSANSVILVRDMIMPQLSIPIQAAIDAITPSISAEGEWNIGENSTGVMAAGLVKSPDGSLWKLTGISNTGTSPTYTKVYDPN